MDVKVAYGSDGDKGRQDSIVESGHFIASPVAFFSVSASYPWRYDLKDERSNMSTTDNAIAPVAIIMFNRPDFVIGLIDSMRFVEPRRIFIISDGPRNHHDQHLVERCRSLVEKIDWPCAITCIFSSKNMGCRDRVSSGIKQVFDVVDRCIILEDDIRPDPSFFRFASEMLEYYAGDERIASIAGGSYTGKDIPGSASYHFSPFCITWGWATWRRVWTNYDVKMRSWPDLKKMGWLNYIFRDHGEAAHFTQVFDQTYHSKINTWDYQFLMMCWQTHRLNVIPNLNMCRNIGFESMNATHPAFDTPISKVEAKKMLFPIRHPSVMIPSPGAIEEFRRSHPIRIDHFF